MDASPRHTHEIDKFGSSAATMPDSVCELNPTQVVGGIHGVTTAVCQPHDMRQGHM